MAKPLIAIVGDTGSGKSDLAMRIAKEYNGEIICADAWTIRKDMDIGTAKPSLQDQRTVPHHLLDLVYPNQSFSAADFQKRANVVINNIHKRNKLPIIVGGSGLYIDSVLYNYSFLTTDSNFDRHELNNLETSELLAIIHKEQINIGGVDTSNKRRLIRLIETSGQHGTKQELRQGSLILGISIESGVLKERLTARLHKMLVAGLEEEVRTLSDDYGWQAEAMKGVGYREWQGYFSGLINKPELKEQIIKDSLMLAKKQRTWFKRNKDIKWLTTPINWQELVDLMTTVVNSQV